MDLRCKTTAAPRIEVTANVAPGSVGDAVGDGAAGEAKHRTQQQHAIGGGVCVAAAIDIERGQMNIGRDLCPRGSWRADDRCTLGDRTFGEPKHGAQDHQAVGGGRDHAVAINIEHAALRCANYGMLETGGKCGGLGREPSGESAVAHRRGEFVAERGHLRHAVVDRVERHAVARACRTLRQSHLTRRPHYCSEDETGQHSAR